MRFAWRPAKYRANLRAHGIDFSDAIVIFDGPTWERFDDRQDYGEERWVAIGLMRGVEITVVYTDLLTEGEEVRWIISARRATRDERETFYGTRGR